MKSQWFVYMIRTEKDRLYTGITTDVERRFSEHSDSPKGAKYFRSDRPIEVVYVEALMNRSEASKREAEIKKMRRSEKERLIT